MNSPAPEERFSRETLSRDFFASIVVFLVAVPLCMGIAIASGVPVSAGLVTGIVGGLVVGTISGAPLQVSGPAAGLTVIVYEAVQTHGLEMLGLIVLMAGLIQAAAGLLRLGQWFRAVSPAVIYGMLAGIGILILGSQFHVMLDDEPKEGGLRNLITIPYAVAHAFDDPSFPGHAQRVERRQLLQDLGELHRRQAQIEEEVHERLPDHELPLDELPATAELDDLAARQSEVAEKLDELVDHAALQYDDGSSQLERIRERHEHAKEAVHAAATALEENDPAAAVRTQADAVASIESLLGSHKHHALAAGIGVLTIVVVLLWKGLAPGKLSLVPAPLVAVIVATTVAVVASMPILSVEVPDSIVDELRLPTWAILNDAPWGALFGTAVLVAAVASAESLLCATAVDKLHSGQRAKYDRELFAQGVGNTICGFLGALPMTGVIVRSSANVQAGGKTRLSAILHGVWLLLFVALFTAVLRMVPTACLAAILVHIGYKLVNWKQIASLRDHGWSEVGIYCATVGVIVVEDLLSGVLVGIALSAAKLLYTFSHLETELDVDEEENRAVLKLVGAATFVRLPRFAEALERVPRGYELHLDLERLHYIDHACLDLLSSWSQQHEQTGGSTTIDWERLANTSRNGNGNELERAKEASRVA